LEAKAAWESWQNSEEQRKMLVAARKAKRAQAANRIERRVNLVSLVTFHHQADHDVCFKVQLVLMNWFRDGVMGKLDVGLVWVS
jgi:multidrug resistance efflux pump